MNTHSLQSAEEPHITGELVRCARTIVEREDAAPWMEHMEVLDDPPQAVAGRHGKRRPRIDIEIVRTGRWLRPRFHIEAKRLYRSDSVNEYFGPGGLQMFVNGEYAGGWSSAGMLVMCSVTRALSGCTGWLLVSWPDASKSVRPKIPPVGPRLDGKAGGWMACIRPNTTVIVIGRIWVQYRSFISCLSLHRLGADSGLYRCCLS